MSKEEEFSVIAEEEIDDDLTLLMARSVGVPRLGIFNTYSEKKKYVPLSWVEGAERTLKIKVGKNTKEYDMKVVLEGVTALIKNASDKISLNTVAWRGMQLLGDMLHIPKTARSDADLNLIAENKRDTLWFVYTPKKGTWRVRPCFVETEKEHEALSKYLEEGRPWPTPAISIENGELPASLRNSQFTKELIAVNPARWTEFLLPIAKGMLLGFSDWSGTGDNALGNTLWKILPQPNYRSDESLNAILKVAGSFMEKMMAFLRLWPMLDSAKIEQVSDAAKAGDERQLKKRERFNITGAGDREFKVTRLVDEASIVGFSLIPETRLPGEQDRLITIAEESWEKSLDACSLGGERDPQYACISILNAIQTRDWSLRINDCISGNAAKGGEEEADG